MATGDPTNSALTQITSQSPDNLPDNFPGAVEYANDIVMKSTSAASVLANTAPRPQTTNNRTDNPPVPSKDDTDTQSTARAATSADAPSPQLSHNQQPVNVPGSALEHNTETQECRYTPSFAYTSHNIPDDYLPGTVAVVSETESQRSLPDASSPPPPHAIYNLPGSVECDNDEVQSSSSKPYADAPPPYSSPATQGAVFYTPTTDISRHIPPSQLGYGEYSHTNNAPHPVMLDPDACPVCRVGVVTTEFSIVGICLALFFFPLGLLCCLMMTQKRCIRCGYTFPA